jgi:hypothetical protein
MNGTNCPSGSVYGTRPEGDDIGKEHFQKQDVDTTRPC